MFIAKMTRDQMTMLEYILSIALDCYEDFGLAFDPLDKSIKWKMGNGVWSPPVKTEEH